MRYNFEWDTVKARTNQIKHGIGFEESCAVFKDPRALTLFDSVHDEIEDRWVTMGMVGALCVCVVHHTFRETQGNVVMIRIFSARKATRKEQHQYWGK
ncbi:MAG: BrnT family toxin [Candidatus Omnitrophica bacterium]|nr:BrnT family toxin [Candidatus Omnitrophota bacterium]